MSHDNIGWSRVGVSGRVTADRAKVWGIVVIPSAAAAVTSLYDGLDASSGRQFGPFHVSTKTSTPFMFPYPINFDRGIYVDLTTNMTAVIVIWEPR